MRMTSPMKPDPSACGLPCQRLDCWPSNTMWNTCYKRVKASMPEVTKHKEEHSMKRTIFTVCITALIIALGGLVAYSGVFTPSGPAGVEGVAVVEPTDGNLQDLDKLAGETITALLPRGTKLAQLEIVRVKVKRIRFMDARATDGNRKENSARNNTRSELHWYDLAAVPIEQRLEGKRPWISVLTTKGSIVRGSRDLRADDIKLVVITTAKQVKIIELI